MENENVVVIGHLGGIGKQVVFRLESDGFQVFGYDRESFPSLIIDAMKGKKVYGIVNCAGTTDSDRCLFTNYELPLTIIKGLADNMVSGGSIVNITSINAHAAADENHAYVASKGALRAVTKSLAITLGKRGVRVNAIAPGFIQTKMTRRSFDDLQKRRLVASKSCLGRWGRAREVAGVVSFLLSDDASFITGTTIIVDGGLTAKVF